MRSETNIAQRFNKYSLMKMLMPFLSFTFAFSILYYLNPQSFESMWKGRTYYLFFLFAYFIETVFKEKIFDVKEESFSSLRLVISILISLTPIIYVVIANFYGLNDFIQVLAKENNVYFPDWMPLSTEYLVFAVLFELIILFIYRLRGSTDYAVSALLLGVVGLIYTIDNYYPYGYFTLFQAFVPTTVNLAATVLKSMGYVTIALPPIYGAIPLLVRNGGQAVLSVAWPCAGIDSLIIYTITIALFMKKTIIPLKHRLAYFITGAAVTYLINIFRVVTIFVIAVNGGDYVRFHDYYSHLYSITWITSYPIIIVGSRALWKRIKHK